MLLLFKSLDKATTIFTQFNNYLLVKFYYAVNIKPSRCRKKDYLNEKGFHLLLITL